MVTSNSKREGLRKQIRNLAITSDKQGVTIGDLLVVLGPRGHALFAFIFAIPFVLPVPLPGLSTPFGFIIFFIGIGILVNKAPWLPGRLRRLGVPSKLLHRIDDKAGPKLEKLEHWLRPRWFDFKPGSVCSRSHGLLISLSALLLAMPAPPGGNVGPAAAILFYCLALLERDGLMTVIGTSALIVGISFFGGLAAILISVAN